jgi:hypothetical protein
VAGANDLTLDAPESSPVSSARKSGRGIQAPTQKKKKKPSSEIKRTTAAASVLFLFSFLFRLPPLLNAQSTNSDAAVVGLQAIHILKGDSRSAFLWGSGYQTAADAWVAAGFFRILGATPFVLMFSALALHIGSTFLVFAAARRRFSPWTSLLLALPLVVAPASVHTYALYPPRQLSLTLAIASFFAIHGAAKATGRRAQAWIAVGAALFGFAISADPYPLVLAPIVIGYGIVVALDSMTHRLPLLGVGVIVGLVPFVLLHRAAGAKSGPMGLSPSVVGHNWDLLVKECLPWALSYKVYFAHNVMDYKPWNAPLPVRAVQITGALIVGAIVVSAFVLVRKKTIPRSTRVIGVLGAAAFPVTIGAFLVSVMVMDHFSMRYLAVLTLMLPFASMPLAHHLGGKRFAVLLAPHLIASALCGWVGYGPFVRGIEPVLETPQLKDDYALYELLHAKGITYAEADYWASYRLTLLFHERIVVVPTNAGEDRYPPYRRAFEAAPVFAYVFDPGRSRENVHDAEQSLREKNASVEKTNAGVLTVFVVTRGAN